MVAGFGRSGHAKGDIPGIRFKVSFEFCSPLDSRTTFQIKNMYVLVYFPKIKNLFLLYVYFKYLLLCFLVSYLFIYLWFFLQVMKVANVSLLALYKEKKDKPRS